MSHRCPTGAHPDTQPPPVEAGRPPGRARARWSLAAAVLAGTALAASAVPASGHITGPSPVSVGSVLASTPKVAAGKTFTVTGRVLNEGSRTVRPTVAVRLSKGRKGTTRELGASTLRRLGAGRTLRYSLTVKVPATFAAGTYDVRACAVTSHTSAACRFTKRRLTVTAPRRPATPAPASPSPQAPATPPAAAAPPAKVPPLPDRPGPAYKVLAFTESDGDRSTVPGALEALKELGRDGDFSVTEAADSAAFTDANLAKYRAVVFVGTTGDVLAPAERTAFENYFREGGGFLGLDAAIGAEPSWPFMTELLGTRAAGAPVVADATIKVADRGHVAGKALPERWRHRDTYYNFTSNVRGLSHVLATVDETTYTGGTMGADHPIAWCKDYRGGRSFYSGVGGSAESLADADVRKHLGGAIAWTAGVADPTYSDCGATVLTNFQQTKISAPPNLNEPIGFDILPDKRVIQTARGGQVRLHDPAAGTSKVIATIPVYTNSEDGLYGPAIDNDFATNHWVYLYYAPPTVRIKKCDGTMANVTTPAGSAPTTAADPCVWTDTWGGYFQLSRFKFVDGPDPKLDLGSEQKILQVANNRGACCHVGGDIDFDKHNNLWFVTGDDTPAGGGNSGGFAPFNDQLTNETQTVRLTGTTGGTFTLAYDGQTTAPIAFDATAATVQQALEDLSNIAPGDVLVSGATALPAGTLTVSFRGALAERNLVALTGNTAGLTGASPAVVVATTIEGGLYNSPHVDARRTAQNTNDLRGKVNRIFVKPDGSYRIPEGNLFPESEDTQGDTRPEIYAMGFRNPFRVQIDENDVAYVTDYSPDSATPQQFRGPAGTGRVEIVRKASNYGWPLCVTPSLPYYKWNFNTSTPLDPAAPEPFECGSSDNGPRNTSRWNTGREITPPITQPDIWYSFRDNASPALGTPCFASYGPSPLGSCPQLFPELGGTGSGVGPHGAAKYHYDPTIANPTKFPPYYDNSVFFGEFTRDYLKEIRFDSAGKVLKINSLLDCGQALITTPFQFECDNPMDMQFDASTGTFYLLTYGDGFFAANPDAGLYKWEYVKGQRAPQAVLTATPTNGHAPLPVQFSSEGSKDLDAGDSIKFAWDFDGDGTVDSVDPNPSHTYTANGVYVVKLTVRDSSGKTDSKTTTITVGNTAPTVTINSPVDGDFFEWGEDIPFSVTVTDPEDGPIDCARVKVTFVLVHDQHGHAEDERAACTGVLHTDASDAAHGGYIAGGISVTYVDKGAGGQPALSTTTQYLVQARRQQVEFAQEQSGTTVAAVNVAEPDPGGGQVRGSLDPGDWVALNGKYSLTHMDKAITLRFAGGSATTVGTPRAAVEIHLDSPTGPIAATGTLNATSGNNAYSSQTFPVDFTGSRRLYLVFRAVTGGPATGFGNLNWVGFTGTGAGVTP